MGFKIFLYPPHSPDLSPCDFWLFPKLRGCRYETIEEMKEAVTKVIDRLKQEDLHGAFQKLLERYNKCIAVGGDYFKGDLSFMSVLSIKVPIRKKSRNLLNDPRIYIYIYRLRERGGEGFDNKVLQAEREMFWETKSTLLSFGSNEPSSGLGGMIIYIYIYIYIYVVKTFIYCRVFSLWSVVSFLMTYQPSRVIQCLEILIVKYQWY